MRHEFRYFGYESFVLAALAAVATVTLLVFAHALLNSAAVA